MVDIFSLQEVSTKLGQAHSSLLHGWTPSPSRGQTTKRAERQVISERGRREGCPWAARSWRDVDGRGRPPTASVLGLLRGEDAAHALRDSLPRDTLPSGPFSLIPWRSARFVGPFLGARALAR